MSRRTPLLLLASAVYGGLGLLAGITGARVLARSPLERFAAFSKLPRPRSMDWIEGLQGAARTVDAWERPLSAVIVVLLIVALGLLGPLLSDRFRLLKPPEENPGKGAAAHLEVGRLLRIGLAVFFSLLLVGVLRPAAAFLPSEGAGALGGAFLGGLPAWTSVLPDPARSVLHSVALFLFLWAVWGAGGPISPDTETTARSRLAWGLLAGLAATPGIAAVTQAQPWLLTRGGAYTLVDISGWRQLFQLAVLLPAAAGLYLALVVGGYRPRSLAKGRLVVPLLVAVIAPLLATIGLQRAQRELVAVDAGVPSLGRLLGVPSSPLGRFALVMTPDGGARYTRTMDGTDDGRGGDPIGANPPTTIGEVERFLAEREFRSYLTFRGFVHLHDCAALDWLSTRTLNLDLDFLEHAPSPVAAELVMERLADSTVTPEHRYVLDQLADPKRFVWPQPLGNRWLGAAYRQFGDSERALEYLKKANLTDREFRSALGGIEPLVDGKIRGTVLVEGRPDKSMRLGLVRAAKSFELGPFCRPYAWRNVMASVYPDARGAFEINNIPDGDYVLIMTWATIGRNRLRPVVVGSPGVIRVDRFRPLNQLAPFDIRFEQPTQYRFRPGESGTTA